MNSATIWGNAGKTLGTRLSRGSVGVFLHVKHRRALPVEPGGAVQRVPLSLSSPRPGSSPFAEICQRLASVSKPQFTFTVWGTGAVTNKTFVRQKETDAVAEISVAGGGRSRRRDDPSNRHVLQSA
jgi:hypothetical protein